MIIVSTPQATGIGPTALGGAGAGKTMPIPTAVAQTLIKVATPVMSADGYTALTEGEGGGGGGSATSGLPSWWKGAAVVAALGVGYVVLKRKRAPVAP